MTSEDRVKAILFRINLLEYKKSIITQLIADSTDKARALSLIDSFKSRVDTLNNELEKILESITETEYNNMFKYYNEIKHLFQLEGMSNQIIKEINN